MTVVGDAWVIIRAITKNLNKDIKDGLDGAAKDAEKSGNRVGESFRKGISDKFDDDFNRRGEGIGEKLGKQVLAGLGGALSGLASLTGMFAMVTGLTGLIGGLIGAVGALAAGAVALTAALGPALAAIGVVGVAALGAFVGVAGVAVGIFKQLGDASTKNAMAVKNAWKGVSKQFTDVFAKVGEAKVFGPLSDLVKTLGDELFPSLSRAIEGFGGVIGNTITRVNQLFESKLFQGSLNKALDGMVGLADSFGAGLVNLAAVFVHLIAAAKPAIDMFSGWFRKWSENLRTMTEAGTETGKLGEFFRTAAAKGAQFFDILRNLWDVLRNVFRAASPLGGVFLDNFQRGTQALADFTASARGAKEAFNFFEPGGQVHQNISAVWGLVKELGSSIAKLTQAKGIESLANGIRQLLPGATQILIGAVDAVGKFAKALGDGASSAAGLRGIKAVKDGLGDLGDAFAELGPAIGPLLEIIGDLASNLARALGPAFRAISDALPDVVQSLKETGAALGDVLGDAIKAIVPLIPPLLDVVASLAKALSGPLSLAIGAAASMVMPLIKAVGALLNVLEPLGPAIVTVTAAFFALMALSRIGTLLQVTGGFMMFAGRAGGVLATSIGAAGAAVRGLGFVLPGLAIGLTAATMLFQSHERQIDSWANSLIEGGKKAATAQREIANPSVWQTVSTHMLHMFESGSAAEIQLHHVRMEMKEQLAQMSPLERAQALLTQATNDYTYSLDTLGPSSEKTRAAHRDMIAAQAEADVATYNSRIANEQYSDAVTQVADAIWGKIDAEMAASNSGVQAEQSAIRMAEAYQRMIDVQNDPNADPLKRRDAELDYASALNTTTATLKTNAKAFAETAVANGQFKSVGEAMAFSLNEQAGKYEALAATVDGPYKDALLNAAKVARDQANQAFAPKVDVTGAVAGLQGFSNYMSSLVGKKFESKIEITGTDAASEQVSYIMDSLLDFSEIVPKAEIDVVSDKADATIQEILGSLDDIDAKTPVAEVQARVDEARGNLRNVLLDMLTVDGQEPSAEVTAYVDQAMSGLDTVMQGMLEANNATATPDVLLLDGQFTGTYVDTITKIQQLNIMKPTPTASLNPGPFNGVAGTVMAGLANIGRQTPSPTASLIDAATGPAAAIVRAIAAIKDKSVTVTATYKRVGAGTAEAHMGGAAGGGRINTDAWTTVGEEGRELVFLTQGQYVATYQKARRILAAASVQAAGIAGGGGGTTTLAPVPVAGGGNVTIPISVHPSAGMDELDLARKTGREFAFQYRKIT